MSDFILEPAPALGGYSASFEALELREITDLAVVSIALPTGGEAKAEKAIARAFDITIPAVGKSTLTGDGKMRFMRLGTDMLFAIFPGNTPSANNLIAGKLGAAAYITDQTDVWVTLELSGQNARTALERICPIDLHEKAFLMDDVARTSMEHLGTLIIRTGADTFLLMSASSSARSFLHAVETSVKIIL